MKSFAIFAIVAATAVPGVALAQAPVAAPATGAPVAAGATVYDTAGGIVGTVESTDGTNAVINTGTVKAAIPVSSLGAGAKGPVLAMTKVQLETAAGQQQATASADFKSKLVPGAAVFGTGGTQLGTIKAVDASGVVVTTTSGDAKLPTGGFGPGPSGITIGMTAEQFKAALSAAAPAATANAAGTATTGAATADATTAATAAPATIADAAAEPDPAATPAPKKKKKTRN